MRSALLFLLLICFCRAQAQYDTLLQVKGRVADARTGAPVQARLTFSLAPGGDNVYLTRTLGSEGRYQVRLAEKQLYTVEIEAEGYRPLYQAFDPGKGRQAKGDFVLEPDEKGTTLRLENLNFGQGNALIMAEAHRELDSLAAQLLANPRMVVQLEGHTDFRGSEAANRELAQSRVEAVKDYLVEKGVSKKRIRVKAYGGTQPLSRADTEEARSRNRRVEVRVLRD